MQMRPPAIFGDNFSFGKNLQNVAQMPMKGKEKILALRWIIFQQVAANSETINIFLSF